jgi:hypothetical protein
MEIEEVEDADGNKPAPKPDKEAREAIKVRHIVTCSDRSSRRGFERAGSLDFRPELEPGRLDSRLSSSCPIVLLPTFEPVSNSSITPSFPRFDCLNLLTPLSI